jgi:hypothetical protein
MWTFEHSVECKVDRNFAWQFWTDVGNWPEVDSSLEHTTLEGRFQSGARITTKPRGGETIHGQLQNVEDGHSAVVMIQLRGAALRYAWKFEDAGISRTRISRQARIEGERAPDYVSTAVPQLEKGIPLGMRKLAETIEQLALGAALGRWFCLF